MNIFTYGSLMFEEVWSQIVSQKYEYSDAYVKGYARKKVINEDYPGIIPGDKDLIVNGKVYFDISDHDLESLDRFEGDMYKKDLVKCYLDKGSTVTALLYVIKNEYISQISNEEWIPDLFSDRILKRFIYTYKGFF